MPTRCHATCSEGGGYGARRSDKFTMPISDYVSNAVPDITAMRFLQTGTIKYQSPFGTAAMAFATTGDKSVAPPEGRAEPRVHKGQALCEGNSNRTKGGETPGLLTVT